MASPRKPPAKKPTKQKTSMKASTGKLKEIALRPAAEEFGSAYSVVGREAGESAAKITRSILRVVDAAARGMNNVCDWLAEALAPRLEQVQPDKIADAEPRILLPAATALTYSMDDELIREMFANLISANMNLDTRPAPIRRLSR